MIYTVTFNPSLDYTVTVDDFLLGKTNRTASEQMTPGGKGINVSAVLRNLGVETKLLGFTAGFDSDMIFPMIVGKLVGGVSAVAVAMVLTRKEENRG